ncbi:hypothetical protein GCK32_000001, partial [Trichostrongylus colubriformis]
GVAWAVSLLICLPPIFGWRPERLPGECAVSTDVGYVLYSSLGSFYIPVIILVLVYARIYSITIKHSRQRLKETERRDQTLTLLTAKPAKKVTLGLLEDNSDGDEKEHANKEEINRVCWHLGKASEELPPLNHVLQKNSFDHKPLTAPKSEKEMGAEKRRRKLKAKERQATMLLGIILSAFILSWLPFFVLYVSGAFGFEAPAVVFKFFFWLGY